MPAAGTTGRSRRADQRSDGGVTGVWIAGATLVTYWGLAIVSFLLRAVNDPTTDVADAVLTRLGWGAYPTVGAVIVARRPHNRIGWLCCAVGLLLGPAFFGQDYAWYALVHKRGSLPGGLAMAWLGLWPWYVVLGLLSFVLLLFPSGQLASPRWRPVAWVAATATAAMGLSAAFEPRPLEGFGLDGLTNPLGIQSAETIFKVLETAVAAIGLVTILAAASMVGPFRRARGDERQQLKWLTSAAVLSVLVWLAFIVTGVVDRAPTALRIVIASTWLLAVPVAIGVAMLRYRLYDIDRLINRAVVYGLLTALLGAVYTGVVLVFGQLFGGIGAQPPSWAVAGATLAVAALFQPARWRIQQVVDRRFNRRRHDDRGIQRPAPRRDRPRLPLGRAACRGRPHHRADNGVAVATTASSATPNRLMVDGLTSTAARRGARQPCLVDGVDCARHALQPRTCPGPIRGEQP